MNKEDKMFLLFQTLTDSTRTRYDTFVRERLKILEEFITINSVEAVKDLYIKLGFFDGNFETAKLKVIDLLKWFGDTLTETFKIGLNREVIHCIRYLACCDKNEKMKLQLYFFKHHDNPRMFFDYLKDLIGYDEIRIEREIINTIKTSFHKSFNRQIDSLKHLHYLGQFLNYLYNDKSYYKNVFEKAHEEQLKNFNAINSHLDSLIDTHLF